MESTAERLQQLITVLGAKSVSAFAASIGVRSTVLANMLGGRMSKPSFDTLEKIKGRYPQVNLEWLVMGAGQPLAAFPSYSNPAQLPASSVDPGPRSFDKAAPSNQELQAALAECQRELAIWQDKAEMYKQLADDRQTIIELMKQTR